MKNTDKKYTIPGFMGLLLCLSLPENVLGIEKNSSSPNQTMIEIETNEQTVTSQVDRSQELVVFKDLNLRNLIKTTLGKSDYNITIEDMSKLTELKILWFTPSIKDLTGLEHAVNLEYLEIDHSKLGDLSQISQLSGLKTLILGDLAEGTDLTPIQSLTQLEKFELKSFSGYSFDLELIKNFSDLKNLKLSHAKLLNIDVIENLTSLTNLDLSGNKLTDLTPLSSLVNLECLDLSGNNIQSTQALASLKNLIWLDLGTNQLTTINGLENLTNLQFLDLSVNDIMDIQSISNLKQLITLNISHNKIQDIQPLAQLTNLIELHAHYNAISDASVLANLTNLLGAMLDCNQIKDFSFLNSLSSNFYLTAADQVVTIEIPLLYNKIKNPIKDDLGNYLELYPFLGEDFFGQSDDLSELLFENQTESSSIQLMGEFQPSKQLGADPINIYVLINFKDQEVTPPLIESEDVILTLNDTFDPYQFAKAYNELKEELPLEITFNDVDTTKSGIYKVTYQAIDEFGVSNTKTIQVIVNSKPIIEANNQIISVGDNYNPLEHVIATDYEDGTIELTLDNIISNNVNPNKPGVYEVTFRVADSHGAITTKTIQVTVKATDKNNDTANEDLTNESEEGSTDNNKNDNQLTDDSVQENQINNDNKHEQSTDTSNQENNINKNETNKEIIETGFSSDFNLLLGGTCLLTGVYLRQKRKNN